MKKTNKGITLIALIITIVVMLVLVGVIVSTTINSNLINKVKTAGGKWKEAEGKDGNIDGATIGGLKYNNLQDYVDGKIPTLDKDELEEKIEAIEGDALIDIHGAEVPLSLWGVEVIWGEPYYAGLTSYNGEIQGGKIQGNIPVMYKKDGDIYDVTDLWGFLFQDRTELETIEIPEGIKRLNGWIFNGCTNLKSVTLPNTLLSIGDFEFNGCTQLSNIKLPDSLETIGWYAFQSCDALTSLKIPSNVSYINPTFASACDGLVNLIVDEKNPNYSSSDGILYNKNQTELILCLISKQGEVVIPSGVERIGDYAFDQCCNLTSITIPEGVTTIGTYAFNNCINLNELVLPESLTTIGSRAFQSVNNIQSLTIPASVTNIETGAFDNMWSLTSLVVADANAYYSADDNILYNKNQTELIFCLREKEGEISIPDTVTTIADYAFNSCRLITKITIPDSVESIGIDAFGSTSMLTDIEVGANNTNYSSEEGILYKLDNGIKTEILCCIQTKTGDFTIPDTVKKIHYCAFYYCALSTIYVPASVETFENQCFDSDNLTNISVATQQQKDSIQGWINRDIITVR